MPTSTLLQKLKMRLLPPSSRSFHDHDAIVRDALGDISRRIDQLQLSTDTLSRITGELRGAVATHEEVNNARESVLAQLKVNATHSRLYHEALLRHENENADEAKRRFFASIPAAKGAARDMQLCEAKLMAALDEICARESIPYWLSFGSLVATLSRSGFIPWDDDIDICMMREDVQRLYTLLKDDKRYQLTMVFDRWVHCRQMRFSLRNSKIPCFIDVCIFDWARNCAPESDKQLRDLRLELMQDLANRDDTFPYWQQHSYLFAPGDGYVVQAGPVDPSEQDPEQTEHECRAIERVFHAYWQKAHDLGILCDKQEAQGVAYALDNIYDAPWRRYLWPLEKIFPVKRHLFEKYLFCIPADAEWVADECYPGWPYLPDDILGHDHFDRETLSNSEISEQMLSFLASEK